MPPRPPKPCRKAGCSKLGQNANGFCDLHQEYAAKAEADSLSARRKVEDSRRGNSTQRGYGGKWRKARIEFLKENPLCTECALSSLVVPGLVVDHIVPHRGDMKLFWSRRNWQSLCFRHHNEKTARGE